MSEMPILPKIRSNVFIEARENVGLSAKELANLACISTRQVQQIENGGTDSFYSSKIKVNAAKKVAVILNLNESECFEVLDNAPTEGLAVKNGNAEGQAKSVEKHAEAVLPSNQSVSKYEFTQASLALDKPRFSAKKVFWILVFLVLVVLYIAHLNFDFFSVAKKAEEVAVSPDVAVVAEKANDQNSIIEKPVEQGNSSSNQPNDVVELKPVSPPLAALTPSAPEVAASPSSTDIVVSENSCPAPDASMGTFKPTIANKSGDMVYLQSKVQQVVCVIDATGRLQGKSLDAGAGISFYGRPPFKVLTTNLDQTEMYFQGQRVRPSNPDGKSVLLEQAD